MIETSSFFLQNPDFYWNSTPKNSIRRIKENLRPVKCNHRELLKT